MSSIDERWREKEGKEGKEIRAEKGNEERGDEKKKKRQKKKKIKKKSKIIKKKRQLGIFGRGWVLLFSSYYWVWWFLPSNNKFCKF